jgi:hypothetical protein
MPRPQQRLDLDLRTIKRHHAACSNDATEDRKPNRGEHEESERHGRIASRDRTDCSRDNEEAAQDQFQQPQSPFTARATPQNLAIRTGRGLGHFQDPLPFSTDGHCFENAGSC